MDAAANASGVRHNPAESRFEVEVDGHRGVAEYEVRDGEMILTHTYVPVELRGRGLAEQLVRATLAHAAAARLRVVPACSYVAKFIATHPEYRPLLG